MHFAASGAGGSIPHFTSPKLWQAGTPKPRKAETRHISGTLFSFSELWYENLILDPTEKNCHTIIATLEYAIIIWNSSRFDTLTFAIERIGWEGIEDTIPSTLTLAPLEHKVYTIAVTMGGAAIIDGRLRFSKALAGTAEHHVFGKRGVVWGFRPNAGLKERWEWKTEINKTWDYTDMRGEAQKTPVMPSRHRLAVVFSATTLCPALTTALTCCSKRGKKYGTVYIS